MNAYVSVNKHSNGPLATWRCLSGGKFSDRTWDPSQYLLPEGSCEFFRFSKLTPNQTARATSKQYLHQLIGLIFGEESFPSCFWRMSIPSNFFIHSSPRTWPCSSNSSTPISCASCRWWGGTKDVWLEQRGMEWQEYTVTHCTLQKTDEIMMKSQEFEAWKIEYTLLPG